MKVSKLEKCIKEKDLRITRLETLDEERTKDRANWINFSAFVYLISVLLVAGMLYYIYYPENIQYRDIIAVSGLTVMLFNAVLTGFVLIFDKLGDKDFDLAFGYVVGNLVVIPCSLFFSVIFLGGSLF